MSEHEGNVSLCSLFKTFTEELEELEDNEYSDNINKNNVDSDNVDGENKFLNPCTDLNERNLSFLHKILEGNDEISSSNSDSYKNETELDFESADNSGDESEEIQFSYNNEFDKIIPILEQKELIACVVINLINAKLPQTQQNISQASGSNNQVDNLELNNQVRQKRRQTTPEKEKILKELLVYKEELPDTAINEVSVGLVSFQAIGLKLKLKQHRDIVKLKVSIIIKTQETKIH
ncbi:10314_t:CDS:2 [Funneliformis caledonium]|uniref:10314_t:CDS:1 n=1 Tax=Funneliformis caledonium TaxID=1117310 RepID=A0A9N8V0Z7_9GLOM|nr:10314_t:CDS:2 [Funneliformis caledonium]